MNEKCNIIFYIHLPCIIYLDTIIHHNKYSVILPYIYEIRLILLQILVSKKFYIHLCYKLQKVKFIPMVVIINWSIDWKRKYIYLTLKQMLEVLIHFFCNSKIDQIYGHFKFIYERFSLWTKIHKQQTSIKETIYIIYLYDVNRYCEVSYLPTILMVRKSTFLYYIHIYIYVHSTLQGGKII